MKVQVKTNNLPPNPMIRIDLEFNKNSLKVLDTYLGTKVQLEDCPASGEVGGPELPGKTLWVGLPPGMQANGLKIVSIEKELISDNPVQPLPLQPRNLDIPDIPHETVQPHNLTVFRQKPAYVPGNQKLFDLAQKSPRPAARIVETRWIGPIPVVLLDISPVRWLLTKQLELTVSLKIDIELTKANEYKAHTDESASRIDAVTDLQANRLFEMVKTMVINPAEISELPEYKSITSHTLGNTGDVPTNKQPMPPQAFDCLIITDNHTWDPTFAVNTGAVQGDLVDAFNKLANWRILSGVRTKVVTISDILAGLYGDFGSVSCVFMTRNGHYLTIVGGGGKNGDVVHTDAVAIGPWEKFTFVKSGKEVALKTANGCFLGAVNGGGRQQDAVKTDAKTIRNWEKFKTVSLGGGLLALQTMDGHYLTAVGGGNRTLDVLHTDATSIGPWEKFRAITLPNRQTALQTADGHYLNAVGGGGRNGDVLHTDTVVLGTWEQIRLIPQGGNIYALRTVNGNYLSAVDGGGRNLDAMHSDATAIGSWEKFTMISLGPGQFALQTPNGRYVTAVNGGGKNTDAIHTDATAIGPDEKFTFARGPYAFLTDNGHYLTAVDGGGKVTDVIHTDATALLEDEKFALISLGLNKYALRTRKGFYLTALNGGGQTPAVIQTDKTTIGNYEKFSLVSLGGDQYALRTYSGNYLNAVNGGGRTNDVVHTDAGTIGPWEKFTRESQGGNRYALRTIDGHYLSSVDGGGRSDDAIHSDAGTIGPNEVFGFISQGGNQYALQTAKGNYLTVVGGGGRNSDVIHTDAKAIGPWEEFKLILQPSGQIGLQCSNGQQFQAVDGGGRSADTIRTDIPYIASWERFTPVPVDQDDLQSILRKFIRWAYESWNISYLLLGGGTSIVPIHFTQVNGPWGMTSVPTDFYYSSLYKHENGLRTPYAWSDGRSVQYCSDVSVGRAPVTNANEADTFVRKVKAYDQLQTLNGTPLSSNWKRKILFAASSWGRDRDGWDKQLDIFSTSANPPGNNQYFHALGTNRTLIRLADILQGGQHLLVQYTESDLRPIPYRNDASNSIRGWFFARENGNLNNPLPSIDASGQPIPTHWAVVFSTVVELDQMRWFTFNPVTREGSTADEETLRKQISSEIPGWNLVSRLYCDEPDLTPAEMSAGTVQHISVPGMRDMLNQGQHIVSLSGHGNCSGALWEPDPVLANINYYLNKDLVRNLNSGNLSAIVYADSCQTNCFIESSISKELMLNKQGGAVAYIGYTNNVVIGAGKEFQKKFFHGIAQSSTLGIAHDARLAAFGIGMSDVEVCYHILMMSLLGDPCLVLHK
jgi:hypothetical protein